MLRDETLAMATKTAVGLMQEKSVCLQAKPGTPLGALVAHCTIPFKISEADPANFDSWISAVASLTRGSLDDPSDHSREIDSLTSSLSQLVMSHISFVRTVVMPEMSDAHKSFSTLQQTHKPTGPADEFEILRLGLPALAYSTSLLDTMSGFDGKPSYWPSDMMKFPAKSSEELKAFIMTPQASLNADIDQWLVKMPADFLLNIWRYYFMAAGRAEGSGETVFDIFTQANEYLAVYLFIKKLETDVQSVGKSLASYQDVMGRAKAWAASSFLKHKKLCEISTTNNSLILSSVRKPLSSPAVTNLFGRVVSVNDIVYQRFLAEGGTPEVLLGACYENTNDRRMEDLLKNKESHLKNWNRYLGFYDYTQFTQLADVYRGFLWRHFTSKLDEVKKNEGVQNLEAEYHRANHGAAEAIRAEAKAFIDKLVYKDFDTPETVFLPLYAKIRFGYTNAFQFLSDMQDVCRANPQIDPKEASAIASMNYLCDYLAAQITVAR